MDIFGRRWTETGDLHDNSFIAGFCEVIPKRWLCVEAAGR
jgi:hypothetical protein